MTQEIKTSCNSCGAIVTASVKNARTNSLVCSSCGNLIQVRTTKASKQEKKKKD